jgi:hypothetical protein
MIGRQSRQPSQAPQYFRVAKTVSYAGRMERVLRTGVVVDCYDGPESNRVTPTLSFTPHFGQNDVYVTDIFDPSSTALRVDTTCQRGSVTRLLPENRKAGER